MTEPMPPLEADTALTAARSAVSAARAARRVPVWHPPAAGLLFAAGFGGLALFDAHPDAWAYLVGGLVCLIAFLVLSVVSSRAGGVALWPTGDTRGRALRQSVALIPLAAAGVATVFLGFPAFLTVFGLGLGALTWIQMAQARKGLPA
ncbi:hypothetical protein [Streptomyces sp. NPDC052036]|uniref:hypothetical protein n=1 Tax=Streptomyces sp. NPDC052036 TaxID=3155171 RepID=UPI003447F461